MMYDDEYYYYARCWTYVMRRLDPHAVLERGKPDSLAHEAHDGRALRMILEHSV